MRSPLVLKTDPTRNWGDALAPLLVTRLSGLAPRRVPLREPCARENLLTVGSVLRMADASSVVWGSGFVAADDGIGLRDWSPGLRRVLARPKKVLAVRGPHTRAMLLAYEVPCPEVYGDPALLAPRLFEASARTRYALGVVPHYRDRHHPALRALRAAARVRVIDVRVGKLGALLGRPDLGRFVREITACEKIVSSSLHGLVLAESFGIPSERAIFGEPPLGGDFKFEDFFASVGRAGETTLHLDAPTSARRILDGFSGGLGHFDPDPLLAAFPEQIRDRGCSG